jgi:small nuclear ribonucleoprotein (snRNP)-like protein
MSAPGKWGKEPWEFIHDLRDKRVLISLANGKALKGILIGADPYAWVIRQDSGLELMINKGSVAYVHATRDEG